VASPTDSPAKSDEPEYKRLTFDIGGSSNFSNGSQAIEGHVGINYYLQRWLVWRNSPFFRSQSGLDTQFGLDSSLEGQVSYKLDDDIIPNARLGGGYRLINAAGSSAPFVEGGIGANIKGVGISASAKHILHSVVSSGATNETLFSFGFSGGLSL
jgi:hypothetical protein